MKKNYFFLSGLPRSGSTLLSAILGQNPNIYSGPSSPVLHAMINMEKMLSEDEFFKAYPKTQQAGEIIQNIINHYYSDIEEPIIIDKNRGWPAYLHYIKGYFGIEPKVLVPVRNMDEILASFIALHRRNDFYVDGKVNFIDEMLIKNDLELNDENRCTILANQGPISISYQAILKGLEDGYERNMLFIEYNDLVNSTQETIKRVYDFLELEYYNHGFENIKNVNQENDGKTYGFKDMHEVRPIISKTSIDPNEILPKSIMQYCKGAEFWRSIDN